MCLLSMLCLQQPAFAHDPFDGNIQLVVRSDELDVSVTLGFDAARSLLASAGITPILASQLKRDAAETGTAVLPPAVVGHLIILSAGTRPIVPSVCLVAFGQDETRFLARYPRPSTRTVELQARYYAAIDAMHAGLLISADAQHRLLFSQTISRERPVATVPLTIEAARVEGAAVGSFGFFRLGIAHILTGFDHLLFLCTLLLSVHRFRTMLAIITVFTCAHSITLAAAAMHLARVSPTVIEPLIALSIIVASVANLRRDGPGRATLWIAGGFGLIHGFGFAGALLEAGLGQSGNSIALPLFSFNLGVETGQLAVAAFVIPLLLLARRLPKFVHLGVPVLSGVTILTSGFWLAERFQ